MRQTLLPGSSNEKGELSWFGHNVVSIARRYGTPLIVYSLDRIEDNYYRLHNALKSSLERFAVRYAIKANSNSVILSHISQMGCGADASSIYEIDLALKAGFPNSRVSFTPNNISRTEMINAIDKGVTVNFDSIGQFNMVVDHLPHCVSFRIKSAYGRGEFKGITTSGHGAKFGELPENAVLGYRKAKELGRRHFGIHIMAGSNVRDATHFLKVVENISDIALRIESEAGINFDYMDIGGGFGVPYRPDESALDVGAVMSGIREILIEKFGTRGRDIPEIVIEPGRYLVADAGLLLGTVYDIKRHEKNYVGTDLGMNILIRPALYGAYHHIVVATGLDREADFKCDITGQICENTDRIATDITIAESVEGDIIAVYNSGAYVSSMSNNYNGRPKPAEVIIHKGKDFLALQE